MTAAEHIKLFSQIKILNRKDLDINALIEYRLKEVDLFESANLQVGKFSGGMRRRMSVCLSTVGDPFVILMDEPTTGMDPVSRK